MTPPPAAKERTLPGGFPRSGTTEALAHAASCRVFFILGGSGASTSAQLSSSQILKSRGRLATAALRRSGAAMLDDHHWNSSGIIRVALAQVGWCLSRLRKKRTCRTSLPRVRLNSEALALDGRCRGFFCLGQARQRRFNESVTLKLSNSKILMAHGAGEHRGGAPHGSTAPRSIATGNRSGIICVALVHLEAVHDGHERSEFGRMQASRRPNQR